MDWNVETVTKYASLQHLWGRLCLLLTSGYNGGRDTLLCTPSSFSGTESSSSSHSAAGSASCGGGPGGDHEPSSSTSPTSVISRAKRRSDDVEDHRRRRRGRRVFRPLHAAVAIPRAAEEMVRFVLSVYGRRTVAERDERGRNALHVVAARRLRRGGGRRRRSWSDAERRTTSSSSLVDLLLEGNEDAARRADEDGRLPLHAAVAHGADFPRHRDHHDDDDDHDHDDAGLESLLRAHPDALHMVDPVTRLYPSMLAA